jgi:hypothetical protein
MKIWMLIVFLGKIGGAIGPLPYDMVECRARAADYNEELDEKWIDHYFVPPGEIIPRWLVRSDMGFRCVEALERPILGASIEKE